jgi:hypothetical protein
MTRVLVVGRSKALDYCKAGVSLPMVTVEVPAERHSAGPLRAKEGTTRPEYNEGRSGEGSFPIELV